MNNIISLNNYNFDKKVLKSKKKIRKATSKKLFAKFTETTKFRNVRGKILGNLNKEIKCDKENSLKMSNIKQHTTALMILVAKILSNFLLQLSPEAKPIIN
jgi:hypothetical protein